MISIEPTEPQHTNTTDALRNWTAPKQSQPTKPLHPHPRFKRGSQPLFDSNQIRTITEMALANVSVKSIAAYANTTPQTIYAIFDPSRNTYKNTLQHTLTLLGITTTRIVTIYHRSGKEGVYKVFPTPKWLLRKLIAFSLSNVQED